MRSSILVIVGPTASGKTETALQTARVEGGEILSADSRQIYRRLGVGTAKPRGEWDAEGLYRVDGIPYHLVDFLEPDQKFSAADFQRQAEAKIEEIAARGRAVIIAGGTGFYLKALMEGLAELPAADEAVRQELRALADRQGRPRLHEELAKVDPAAASQIPANNIQRVIRALEVYRLTGKPISSWHAEHRQTSQAGRKHSFEVIGLAPEREELERRITERARAMLRDGMIAETESALKAGFQEDCPGLSGLGYPRVIAYLHGRLTRPEMLELLIQDTRQYAKRQMTWFRNQMEVQWKKS